jgi:hypothetical protein
MNFYRPDRPRLYVARATQKPRRARLLWALLAVVLLLATAARAASKYITKVSHLSERMVSVSCTDGSQPTTQKAGDVLLISCGKVL